MRIELTDDPAAFRTRDWSDVVAADPAGTLFHTPAYLKLWWEEFGSGSLLLAAVLDGDRTMGACGFEIVQGQLRFLGGFDVTDYMGPVARAGLEASVADQLMSALADERWTGADLRGLPVESRWFSAVDAAARARGWEVRQEEDGIAPMIELPGVAEAYLQGLPAKLRHEIRRKARRLAEESGGYRVRWSTPQTVAADLDRFVELHQSSPGPKGRFMHAGMEIFFRRLGEAFLPLHLFHLAFIEVDGRDAAGAIAFGFKDTLSLYNSAFDREFGRLAPGMVLVADLIRGAIESGRTRFDLLKGDLEYKYRFGATPRPIGRLLLSRH
ncbi:MAG: GNAT family N-acetyltransferase [Actinobacteria bacterium]|nr:MAG: GNAT family N-acetyltransferase [Actinomycetota bacterium]